MYTKLLILALFIGNAVHSLAQNTHPASEGEYAPQVVSPVIVKMDGGAYRSSLTQGKKMRNLGRAMTIVGVPVFVTGLILSNRTESTSTSSQGNIQGVYTENKRKEALTVSMIGGGVAMTGIGLILWYKGAQQYNQYSYRRASLDFSGKHISLYYRF